MDIRFNNQVAIVTGATSGIGRATALRLARSGARLMITGRRQAALEELGVLIARSGVNEGNNEVVSSLAGDIISDRFRRELVDACLEKFGRLDILVNAAGIIASGTILDTSLKDFDYMMDINLRSVFHLMQLAVPHLKKNQGNIVNVSSVTGSRAFPGILGYCVSKAALDQLTRCTALELASKGVRVNAVNPGVVESNLHRSSGMNEDVYKKFLEHSRTTHPLGRVGQPDEIADLITFLASGKASWITGATYNIDGGRHQTCAR